MEKKGVNIELAFMTLAGQLLNNLSSNEELMYSPIHIAYQPSLLNGVGLEVSCKGRHCRCLLISAGADMLSL